MDEEVGKYKKSTDSNVSKSRRKSKHKHIYKPCLIKCKSKWNQHFSVKSYCTICGKVRDSKDLTNIIPMEQQGCYCSALSNEEILERYGHYPIFKTEKIFQQYVCLEGGE